jgi:hypothetical protein
VALDLAALIADAVPPRRRGLRVVVVGPRDGGRGVVVGSGGLGVDVGCHIVRGVVTSDSIWTRSTVFYIYPSRIVIVPHPGLNEEGLGVSKKKFKRKKKGNGAGVENKKERRTRVG